MKYCWTTISVKDLDASIAFYRDIVKLPVKRRFPVGPGSEIAFLGDGETQIELIKHPHEAPPIGAGISLGFAVDSLDETLAFIAKQGIEVESGPFQPTDQIKFFYVLDPNGVRIQFAQST
ncbi:MAG: VOC family protein [Sphaerochaetaceae bacterium]|jgi:lactoylglutathione lyase|nr:VOC family protein [Sphaerochaetaceae bacterium]MDD3366224.1 VOC family protein [Sphaerochaetaceae bacterium]MDD4218800.1 VOC family protein [Sphaerochaetaceae bacterium]MDY0371240.1 VOC family protein [Sphaerochaetaceae bacterium]